MNLRAARVVVRPRNVGEILDLAAMWSFAADRGLYGRLAAVVLIPSLAACLACRYLLEWDWLYIWVLAAGLMTISQGVFTVASGRVMFERDVTARAVLAQYLRRLPSYVGALIISRIVLGVGALFVIFFPFVWIMVAFVHEAALLEMQSPLSATLRARGLSKHKGPEVAMLLAGLLLAIAASIIAAEVLGHGLVDFVLQLGQPLGNLFDDHGSVYALIGFHAAIPYVAVARFLKYIDGRTRSDGWDIQLRFMAIAAEQSTDGEAGPA